MSSARIAKAVVSVGVLAFVVVTSPFAQKPGDKALEPGNGAAQRNGSQVARLQQVQGNVLVSQADGLASAGDSLRLDNGSRVITTANGRAIVIYDDGCEVIVEPNQRLEINRGLQ